MYYLPWIVDCIVDKCRQITVRLALHGWRLNYLVKTIKWNYGPDKRVLRWLGAALQQVTFSRTDTVWQMFLFGSNTRWSLNWSSSGPWWLRADCKRKTNKKKTTLEKKEKNKRIHLVPVWVRLISWYLLASVVWTTVNACWMKSETRGEWRSPGALTWNHLQAADVRHQNNSVLSDLNVLPGICYNFGHVAAFRPSYRITYEQVLVFWPNNVPSVFT